MSLVFTEAKEKKKKEIGKKRRKMADGKKKGENKRAE